MNCKKDNNPTHKDYVLLPYKKAKRNPKLFLDISYLTGSPPDPLIYWWSPWALLQYV